MFTPIKQFLNKAMEYLVGILLIAYIVGMFLLFMRAFEPMWPVFSLLFYVFGTLTAWNGEQREKLMCAGGIFVYALGWAVVLWIGAVASSFVCVAGFLIWFQAFLDSAFRPFKVRIPRSMRVLA